MSSAGTRPRVIAELDARGQIDGHTAMCLRVTLADVVVRHAVEIIFDLRDLTAIDEEAIAHLAQAQRACRARGAQLGLLIGVGASRDELAHALQRAGLNTQSHIADDRALPTPAPRRRRRPRRAFSLTSRLAR